MKIYLSILLALAITLQPLSNLMIVSNYALNVKTITAKYCENKAKPKLKCNGKCHLRKMLIKHDKQSDQNKQSNREVSSFQWYTATSQRVWMPLNTDRNLVNWTYIFNESTAFKPDLLKPPTV